MSISINTKNLVRIRADYGCEFCLINEIDMGGRLTIDHFRPVSKGGTDDLSNLIYCCHNCNRFKYDFFNENDIGPQLWNPRKGGYDQHFLHLNNGHIQGITEKGEFTITLLKLNRSELIAHRFRELKRIEEKKLLKTYESYFDLNSIALPIFLNKKNDEENSQEYYHQLIQIILSKF